MWKRHPLAHFIFGLALALLLGIALAVTIPIGLDFWMDSQNLPVATEGRITKRHLPQLHNGAGRFELRDTQAQLYQFEVSPQILETIPLDTWLKVYHSPRFYHVYTIQLNGGNTLVQDQYEPGAFYQQWQAPFVWLIAGMALGCLGAFLYSLIALLDWLLPPRKVRGVLVSRIEQADNSAAGYALVLRTISKDKDHNLRETCRFQVSQANFLLTDQVDYLKLEYTPLFKYVRHLQVLQMGDFPPGQAPIIEGSSRSQIHYLPGWHFRTFLYSDFVFALLLFSFAALIFITRLPLWFQSSLDAKLYERYILPGLALSAFIISFFLTANFLRKLRDLVAPKKLTVGPVLSKWRVTGVTNDMRRQIVVADGGLQAGSENVRKFEINNTLFDELKVGDIVEIEHSPRLRYIFRLEVTDHQELLKVPN